MEKETAKKSEHKVFLDILRMIAAFAVVLFHVIESSANGDPTISNILKIQMNAISSLLSWHVPVFFMITGFLWLNDNKSCTYQRMLHNIVRFVVVLFTVGYAYAMLERIFITRTFSTENLLMSFVDVLTGNLWAHMWYVYSAIGIYLFLPVIKPFFESQSIKSIFFGGAVVFCFAILFPQVAKANGATFPIEYPMTSTVFYLWIGGAISKIKITPNIAIAVVFILLFNCMIQFLCELKGGIWSELASVLICFSAIAIFIIIRGFFEEHRPIKWIKEVADCSFGIYLIHPLFINVLIKVFHIYPTRYFPVLMSVLVSIGIFIFSFGIIHFLRKISVIRKYML